MKNLLVLLVILVTGSVTSYGQFKMGDKSNIGQTWEVNDTTGASILTTRFDPYKKGSSFYMGKTGYEAKISRTKCTTNKGIQIEVRDTAGNTQYNSDYKCKSYRSYDNPVFVENAYFLKAILDQSTNVEKDVNVPAHCIFKVGDNSDVNDYGDGVLGAWPGQWKDVKYIFYYKFSGLAVSGLSFDLSTIYNGTSDLDSATASYDICLEVKGVSKDTLVNAYTSSDSLMHFDMSSFSVDPNTMSGKEVFIYIYTKGTRTPVAEGTHDPIIGINNLVAECEAAVWYQPWVAANAKYNDTIIVETGKVNPVQIFLEDANRRESLTITNDNDSPKRLDITFDSISALVGNDGAGNYTDTLDYSYKASTADDKGQLQIAAPIDGEPVADDFVLNFGIKPLTIDTTNYYIEIDNGTRFWYKLTVISTAPASISNATVVKSLKIYTANNLVYVEKTTEKVNVINMTGQIVKTISAQEASNGFSLNSGIYVISTGAASGKVVVE